MASVTAPKGTADILPRDSYKWQYLEGKIRDICARFNFSEIRTPVFEHTEVFERGVGDTTDVVSKEMYTFTDKGGRSVTLRPEGTAGVVRAFLENGLFNEPMPAKLYYLINCFRYEKPQKGRLRQFSQFGIELFGATSPAADAMVISLPYTIFKEIGIGDIELKINSIGCKTCRAEYRRALTAYFEDKKDSLCATCNDRLYKNPMRILDCKSEICREISAGAPKILDYLCDDCRAHFDSVKSLLNCMNIGYTVDPYIVRGLDYYNRTVFEFVSSNIGAQGTVCGGGRYGGLLAELGGPDMSGVGFGMGLTRLLLAMEAEGALPALDGGPQVYLAPIGNDERGRAFALAAELRAQGVRAETDLVGRSLKAQMKYADKLGAQHTVVLGTDELSAGECTLLCMATGEKKRIPLSASSIAENL